MRELSDTEGVRKFSQDTRGARRWKMSGEADIEVSEVPVSFSRLNRVLAGGSLKVTEHEYEFDLS